MTSTHQKYYGRKRQKKIRGTTADQRTRKTRKQKAVWDPGLDPGTE